MVVKEGEILVDKPNLGGVNFFNPCGQESSPMFIVVSPDVRKMTGRGISIKGVEENKSYADHYERHNRVPTVYKKSWS